LAGVMERKPRFSERSLLRPDVVIEPLH
jgi:hypothetical protein